MQSFTIENYLKKIYHLTQRENKPVQTNAIADGMNTSAASVTDMIKKLSAKKLVNYTKYQGVTLTEEGNKKAINIIRKHRLWEVFLVNTLHFKWDEVHEIADQLEHVKSDVLIDRLEKHLNYPITDPHGDLIPDKNGLFKDVNFKPLNLLHQNQEATIVGVSEHSSSFLKRLEELNLIIGQKITFINVVDFDNSIEIKILDNQINISKEIAKNILITI
ncbi:MAG: metal-dependent transcriptional regulator [Sphingobacteriaceae bacterium]|nr:metal-dependent transcriptional regulator [Sphingobacteriaceae bacterium]